jgi:hypothetical protein
MMLMLAMMGMMIALTGITSGSLVLGAANAMRLCISAVI